MADELLHCPFCDEKITPFNISGMYWTILHKCKVLDTAICITSNLKEKLISKWNTRAIPPKENEEC